MMINKNRFRISNDKKVLHKIGKRWVTVSALTLALLSGAAAASTVTTHAATTTPAVEAKNTNTVKKQINSNLNSAANSNSAKSTTASAQSSSATKPSAVQSSAANIHNALLQNAANQKPSAKSAGSSVASNAPIHQSAQPNSAYEAYLKQNPQLAQDYYGNTTPSANSKIASNAPKNSVSASSIASNSSASSVSANNSKVSSANQISDKKNKPLMKLGVEHDLTAPNNIQTGTYDGLNYKYDPSNQSIEFTNGTLNWTPNTSNNSLSDKSLIGNSKSTPKNIYNAKSIVFDNTIKFPATTPFIFMLGSNPNVQYMQLSSAFDTTKLYNSNIYCMFDGDKSLKVLNLSGFNTSKASDWGAIFSGDSNLQKIEGLSDLNTQHTRVFTNAFNGDSNLQSLDLSSFDTHTATHSVDGYGNNGLLNTIVGCTGLKTIKLGSNTILTSKTINGDPALSYAQDVNSGVPFGEDLIQLANG